MKLQLIILDTPIIVSDEEKKNGDLSFCLSIHHNNLLPENKDNQINPIRRWFETDNCKTCRKIIAGIEGLPSIDWNGLEEEFGWIDVDKLASKFYGNTGIGAERAAIWKNGFKTALYFNKKKFTAEDMQLAFIEGTNSGALFESMAGDYDSLNDIEEANKIADSDMEDFIQSLEQQQQPKIFDVELEMELPKAKQRGNGGKIIMIYPPKITNNSIKIINKL